MLLATAWATSNQSPPPAHVKHGPPAQDHPVIHSPSESQPTPVRIQHPPPPVRGQRSEVRGQKVRRSVPSIPLVGYRYGYRSRYMYRYMYRSKYSIVSVSLLNTSMRLHCPLTLLLPTLPCTYPALPNAAFSHKRALRLLRVP